MYRDEIEGESRDGGFKMEGRWRQEMEMKVRMEKDRPWKRDAERK